MTVSDTNHTLQGIQGPLIVVGGFGKNDQLTLDDTNGSPGSIYLVKPIEVDRLSWDLAERRTLLLTGNASLTRT